MLSTNLKEFYYVICIILCVSHFSAAQLNHNCFIENVTNTNWLSELKIDIKDTASGDTFKRNTNNISKIASTVHDDQLNQKNYVDVDLTDQILTIKLTDNFALYEENEVAQSFTTTITFNCNSGTGTLKIVHQIEDTNNHDPIFVDPNSGANNYDYKIYTPVGPNFPISLLYGDIIVRDVDLTNYGIIPEIEENEYLKIEYKSMVENNIKNHRILLSTAKLIKTLDDPVTLKISVTDQDTTNDPRRTTHASVTIRADPTTQLPTPPMFEEPFYNSVYTYPNDDVIFEKKIKLSEGYNDDVKFTLSTDGNEYFKLTQNGNEIIISIIKPPLPIDVVMNNVFISFSLIATKEDVFGKTAIIVEFSKDVPLLNFSKSLYSGNYFENHTVSHDVIVLSEGYNDKVVFSLQPDEMNTHFELINEKENVKLAVKKGLTDDILRSNAKLNLIIIANSEETTSAFTILSLQLPGSLAILDFSKPLYSGEYLRDNTVVHDDIVLSDGYNDKVVFTLQPEAMNDHFKITNEKESVKLTVIKELSDDILQPNSVLNLIITAASEETTSAVTILALQLPGSLTMLNFSKPLYSGEYLKDDTVVHDDIVLSEGYNDKVVYGLQPEEMNDHFKLTNEKEIVKLTVTKELSETVLQSNSILNLIITAAPDETTSAITILALRLPGSLAILNFSKPLYSGEYLKDDSVVHDDIVLSEGYNDKVVYGLQPEEMNDHFKLTNEKETVKLTVTKELSEAILQSNSILNLIITAASDETTSAITILALRLPGSLAILNFSKPLYSGEYLKDDSVVHDDIVLSDGYDDKVVFALQPEAMNNHFKITNEKETVKLTVIKELSEAILQSNSILNLIITATSEETTSAVTILALRLPGSLAILNFSKPLYSGEYLKDDTVVHDDIVLRDGYNDKVVFALQPEEMNNHFKLINEKETVKLTVIRKLTDDTLQSNSMLNLIITATSEETTSAITILALQLPAILSVLNFNKPLYVGDYYKNNTVVHDNIVLSKGYNDNVVFKFQPDEMSTYFKLTNVNENIKITVKKPLSDDILKSNSVVNLIISAHLDEAISAITILSLVLPKSVNPPEEHNDFPPLIIINLTEEQPYENILENEDINNCLYQITNSWPKDQEWFSIKNGNLSCSKIDREDERIAFMELSQIQLELSCITENDDYYDSQINSFVDTNLISYSKASACVPNNENRYWIFTENITHSENKRMITFIINDINDNAPEFNQNNPMLIGFPDKEIFSDLNIPFLTNITATDRDICHNADIRYSIDSDFFSIHPKSGIIYYKENIIDAIYDSYKFNVSATDQDGNGNTRLLEIMVKILDKEYITVIIVENAFPENATNILDEISTKLKINMKSLLSYISPQKKSTKFKHTEYQDSDNSLYILSYAFNSEENLMKATEVSRLIEENINGGVEWNVEGITLTDSNILNIYQNIFHDTGLIVAVSILSVLLACTIVAIGIWFFIILPKRYRKFENSDTSSSIQSSRDSENEKGDDGSTKNMKADENALNTANTSDNDGDDISSDSEHLSDSKKPTVHFKETVQQLSYEEERL